VLFPVFRETILDGKAKDGEPLETFESFVEKIIISIDTIPLGLSFVEESITLVQYLNLLVNRTFNLKRIALELQISEFKKRYEDKLLSETVALLEAYFGAKKETIIKYLEDMSLFSHAYSDVNNEKARIEKYLNKTKHILVYRCVEKWAEMNEIRIQVENNKERFCKDSSAFHDYFIQNFSTCMQFCSEYGLSNDEVELTLFDVVLSHITLQEFVEHNREYLDIDRHICRVLEHPRFRESLFGKEKNERAKSERKWGFIPKNPKLLEEAKKAMELIPLLPTPLQKYDGFVRTLKKLVHVCKCEIQEFGADETMPLRLCLLSFATKFTTFASTFHYIHNFMSIALNENDKLAQLSEKLSEENMTHFNVMKSYVQNTDISTLN
jgi:hypothetical protein